MLSTLIVLGTFFGMLLILSICSLSFNESLFSNIWAQSDLQVVKNRNPTLDLGNGTFTNAQLSYPAIGKGPNPAVLLVPGGGPADMNYTAGENAKLFWLIGQFLSERGLSFLNTIRGV
jgi:hypothetical protein